MIKVITNKNELFNNACKLCCEIFKHISIEDVISHDEIISYIDENKVIGIAIINEENDNVCISFLGVDVLHRGKEIGTKIVKWIQYKYQSKILWLHVSVKNDIAIKLYENTGFIKFKIKKKYYDDEGYGIYTGEGLDAYVMIHY
jgi:ribosomal protein S18 acetylase RimI-like enzyme